MKYKQEKHKIRKAWSRTEQNETDLNNKNNSYQNIKIPGNEFKYHTELYDSGWVAKSADGGDVTINTNDILAETIDLGAYDPANTLSVDLDIPDYLAPFVDIALLAKVNDSEESLETFIPMLNFTHFDSDWGKFYVNGSLTFSGKMMESFDKYTTIQCYYLPEYVELGYFMAHPKKVFWGSMKYTYLGNEYWVQGYVTYAGVTLTPYPPLLAYQCSHHTDFDEYQEYLHNITSMTSSGVSFIGDKLWDMWEWTGSYDEWGNPTYGWNRHTLHEQSFSSAWGSNYGVYIYGYRYKKVGTQWVSDTTGYFMVSAPSYSIYEKTFTLVGYWAMFDSKLRYVSGWYNNWDGQRFLPFLPYAPAFSAGTSIRVRRNDYIPTVAASYSASYNTNQKCLVKLQPNKYRIKLTGLLYKKAKAKKEVPTEYPLWDDIYTKPSLGDWIPYLSHGTTSRTYYTTNETDISVKLLITLNNPLQYHEIQKHTT